MFFFSLTVIEQDFGAAISKIDGLLKKNMQARNNCRFKNKWLRGDKLTNCQQEFYDQNTSKETSLSEERQVLTENRHQFYNFNNTELNRLLAELNTLDSEIRFLQIKLKNEIQWGQW